MKDFQDEDFSLELIKKMEHVHKIATQIMSYSYQPKEVIEEVIKTDEGKLIANVVFYLNVPLSEFGSLTKLQRDFLILSKIKPKEKDISKTGDTMDLRELLGGIV